jgi:glutamate-ammonia-ligase adenylyltransferase
MSMELSINAINAIHGPPEGCAADAIPFCIIGYGKLGSRELGFGSDLDMVFISASLPDSAKTTGDRKVYAPQYFARIGQRLVHILSTRTAAGRLYEVDVRLRPSGNSGPLVATIKQMQKYQREKAWTWEHQALVRARFLAGDTGIGEQFTSLRREILTRKRDAAELCRDVLEMREKMREAKNTSGSDEFDLKQDPGGIVDIEFMVQYMVLRWANEYPQLCDHTGTLDLLDLMNEIGLIKPDQHGILDAAFSTWLERSYQLKLNDRDAVIPVSENRELREQVIDAWRHIFHNVSTNS